VKRWQDEAGNLLLKEFHPYMLTIQLDNPETPDPGHFEK
jgi:hypothetical protein